jgi:hypothetical protein
MRVAIIVLAALALGAAPAWAQDEPPTTVPVPTPVGCDRGPGTDADYADCQNPCQVEGTDGDYAYCMAESGPGVTAPVPKGPEVRPIAFTQLPLTGDEPLLVALMGLALVMCGAGLRLRLGLRRRA